MKVYLVGGAVRDKLLGLPITERDWVVVGATPEEMLKLGYRPVGKDFPVFLHPDTHEEYALARTERKVARGYSGFTFYTAPDVTLEQDLARRDLTINAIAQSEQGELIDPFDGREDIERKILRHVSSAFVEDPVRLLRVARFAARFGDFTVDAATMELMREMVDSGEVDALVSERVWQELERTLDLDFPWRFFEILQECGALEKIFPELVAPFARSIDLLKRAVGLTAKGTVRFAAMTSMLKNAEIVALCKRVKVPMRYRELAVLVGRFHQDFYEIQNYSGEKIVEVMDNMDAFRRPERVIDILRGCQACFIEDTSAQAELARQCYRIAMGVKVDAVIAAGYVGKEIGEALQAKRVQAVEQYLKQRSES